MERLHTDGGSAYNNEVIAELNKFMQVQKSKITPGNAQGNGAAENLVNRVRRALTSLAHRHPNQWDRHLPAVQLAINLSICVKTDLVPMQVHQGRMPLPRIDIEEALSQEEAHDDTLPNEVMKGRRWVLETARVMHDTCQVVAKERREALAKVNDRNEQLVASQICAGDLVMWYDSHIKSHRKSDLRLMRPWKGPYLVTKVCRNGQNVMLRLGKEGEKRIHIGQLKRYLLPLEGLYPTTGVGYDRGRPVQILSHREGDERLEYLVKYFTENETVYEWNAWEICPPQLVQEYLLELEYNPHLAKYAEGEVVQVLWPDRMRRYQATIESRQGNLLRVMYLDQSLGEAYIDHEGTITQAWNSDEVTDAPEEGEVHPQ